MYPTFHLGIDFPAYFTLLMVGYTILILIAHRDCFRDGINGNDFLDLAMVMITAGILGARALHVVADEQLDYYVNLCVAPLEVKGQTLPKGAKCTSDAQCAEKELGELCHPTAGTCHQGRDCLRAFKFWYGGLAYYGGLGLAIPIGFWFIRRRRMPFWKVSDLAGYGIPLGLVFGRAGCFLAGCCFGERSDSACAMSFPAWSPAWEQHVDQHLIAKSATESLPVYPTQLWEGGACLAIFLFAYFWLRRRKSFDGQVFFVSMMLYAVARFVIEYWRDDPRGGLLGLSTSQWLGIPLFAWCAFMYWQQRRKMLRAAAIPAAADEGGTA